MGETDVRGVIRLVTIKTIFVFNCVLRVCALSTPAPGYYNDDDTPDFLVHWQYGRGFPVYYHSVVRTFCAKH